MDPIDVLGDKYTLLYNYEDGDSYLYKAIKLAKESHRGQVRKYTGLPYISHPFSVAGLVSSVCDDMDMIVAAILHDVVEDSDVSIEQVREGFGQQVASLVSDLTDVSRPEDGNREARKRLDRIHTSNACSKAKTIKIADLIDNTKTIIAFDSEFAKVYMSEKVKLLKVLTEGDDALLKIANDIVTNYYSKQTKEN